MKQQLKLAGLAVVLSVAATQAIAQEKLKSAISGATVVVPHPKKDLGKGLVRAIYKGAEWKPD
jgi:hypothetical protein